MVRKITSNFSQSVQFFTRYIYFAATTCDKNDSNHRMFVLENTNPDPFNGTFVLKGQITDSTNKWAIDGTVFTHPTGQLYFAWSGWETNVPLGRQMLYIAKMSNPWTITGARVEISRPTYTWETMNKAYVNEGPQFIQNKGVISLVYSASGSWTNNYCLGLLTASNTSNLLNATSWTKRSTPVFQSGNGIIAPGHNCFTKSFDGKEDWIIYHSARYNNSGWIRQVRAQKFTWNADSTPKFGTPAAPNTPITIPSGDPMRVRYEAENATIRSGPAVLASTTASKGMKVGYIDYSTSTVTFTIQAATAGTHVVALRTDNGSPQNSTATHLLSINNGTFSSFSIANGGWDNWGVVMFRTYFKLGTNTITCKKGNNYAEIDSVDIFLNPS